MTSRFPVHDESFVKARVTVLEDLIEKYSIPAELVDQTSRTVGSSVNESNVILLTGTTGNLGSDLLALLLAHPSIRRVYALNRPSSLGSSRERVGALFSDKSLPEHLLDSEKCALIDGKLDKPMCGLEESTYEQLRREVNIVIHNAWPVSLAAPIAKFETSLLGLQNLVQLARSTSGNGKTLARFVFLSTCSSAYFWGLYKPGCPVPEALLHDPKFAAGFGYAESKYVGEHIVARSGLDATSLRIVQLSARDADGVWPPIEPMPIALKFMSETNVIPATLTTKLFPFLPLDLAAKCVAEIALSPQPFADLVLNVAHPRPFKWSQVEAVMKKMVWGSKNMEVVSTDDFVELLLGSEMLGPLQKQLQRIAQTKRMFVLGHPGIMDEKSVDHFPSCAVSTKKAEALSPTLRNIPSTTSRDQEKWVEHWIDAGLFEPAPDAHIQAKL